MRKLLLLALFCAFFNASGVAHAKDPNFDISTKSDYKIQEDGKTIVRQTVSITNKTEFYYTPSYTIHLGFEDIADVTATNQDGAIPTTITDNDNGKSIKLTFPNRYTGMSKVHTFTVQFSTNDVAEKQGNIWEVVIPGVENPDDFADFEITVDAPESFGDPSIIKPETEATESEVLTFSKSKIGRGGLYILYGDKQYYAFTLTYNISNPNLFPVRTEIALPPQTNYQNVLLNSFSHAPLETKRDRDGNWIAEYRLMPQQKQKVVVKGLVEVLPKPNGRGYSGKPEAYTVPKKYWDAQDSEIKKIAATLKTPEDIYEYVASTLSYNYSKVATEDLRLGGAKVLNDKKNSVCLEFTDLFISLARAAGIPARAVEGFAYTQNEKLRPSSLANDILHAWPEYYDKDKKQWIMVDPTWGNTTFGMDYFNSLDFQHVVFAIKGEDSAYPIPAGGYKFDKNSKDVEVSFATKDDFRVIERIVIDDTFPESVFPKTEIAGSFTISNQGNAPVSNIKAVIAGRDGKKREYLLDYIPPRGSKKITTSFSDVPFLTNGSYVITIQVGKEVVKKSIRISFIPDLTQMLFIGGIIGGSIIITGVTFHTGSILAKRRKK